MVLDRNDVTRIASNQMLLNFGHTRSPDESSHKIEETGQRRRKDRPRCAGEPNLGIHPSGVLGLIDTPSDSHKGSLCEPGGGRADEGNRRQYRRGGFVLSQAVFTGSCSDSTRAGRFRGASSAWPDTSASCDSPLPVRPRRHDCSRDTPERAKGLSRKPRSWPTGSSSADTAGGRAWPAGCPRTARPPTSSNARAAGSRAAAWSAATTRGESAGSALRYL